MGEMKGITIMPLTVTTKHSRTPRRCAPTVNRPKSSGSTRASGTGIFARCAVIDGSVRAATSQTSMDSTTSR